MLKALPTQLGLREDEVLLGLRQALLEAIRSAPTPEYKAAWARYQAAIERQLGEAPDPRFLLAVMIAKALVWQEADELFFCLRDLIDAWTYADNLGDQALVAQLQMAVLAYRGTPEHLWASEQYDAALTWYEMHEQNTVLSSKERGLLNLRLAQFYTEMRRQPPPVTEFEPPSQPLADLAMESLQTALLELHGLPEQAKALRLLDELEAEIK